MGRRHEKIAEGDLDVIFRGDGRSTSHLNEATKYLHGARPSVEMMMDDNESQRGVVHRFQPWWMISDKQKSNV